MTHDFLPTPASDTNLNDEIQKNLESFAIFDRWMDEQLEVLVARWIHAAAPNSERAALKRERALSH